MPIFEYRSVLRLSLICILVMCHLPASCCSFLFHRCTYRNYQRLRRKRPVVSTFFSDSLLSVDLSIARRTMGKKRTQIISTRRAPSTIYSSNTPLCRNEDCRLTYQGRIPRYFSTPTSRFRLSSMALWSSVATSLDLEDDDEVDTILSSSRSNPQYILQVKASVTKNDGTAIGFYCFEPQNPDAEPLLGCAYFALNRSAFEAYYSSILSSLEYIRQKNKDIRSVAVQCDHDTVVHQLNDKYDIQRDSLRILYWKIMEVKEAYFDDVRFEFIPKSVNREAAELANKALGSKTLMKYHFDMMDPMSSIKDQTAGSSRTRKSIKGSRLSTVANNMNVALENDNELSEVAAIDKSAIQKMTSAAAMRKESTTTRAEVERASDMDIFESIVDDDLIKEDDTSNHVPSPSISMPNGLLNEDYDTGSHVPSPINPIPSRPMIDPNHTYVLEFDGGSRGNPCGAAGAGMVLYDTGPSGNERREVWAGWNFLGDGDVTNNQAEYSGLIAGLEAALERGVRKIQCFGDSNLIVKHITGEYRVRSAKLLSMWKRTKELLQQFDSYEIYHIRRHLNGRADGLANLAMDSRESGSSD